MKLKFLILFLLIFPAYSATKTDDKIVTVEWDKIKGIFEKTHEITPEEAVENMYKSTAESVRKVFSILGQKEIDKNSVLGEGTFLAMSGNELEIGDFFFTFGQSAGVNVAISIAPITGLILVSIGDDTYGNKINLEESFVDIYSKEYVVKIWKEVYNALLRAIQQDPNLECVVHREDGIAQLQMRVKKGRFVTFEEWAEAQNRITKAVLGVITKYLLGKAVKVYKRTVEADGKSYDVAAVVVHVYSAERVGHDTYDFMVVIKARDGQEVYHAIFTMRLPKGQELLDVAIDNPTDITVEGSSKEVGVFPIAALIKDEETERIFIKGAFISIQNAGEGGRAKIYWPSPPIDEIVVTGLR